MGCTICGRLRDVETSFSKCSAPEYDRPLPGASARLVILDPLGESDVERHHVRRCPECGALYDYRSSSEYHVNGREDEGVLTRLEPPRAAEFRLDRVRRLEALRREIDDLQEAAGSLGDYIDRGRPEPVQEREALSAMDRYVRDASSLRRELQARVESLRRDGPEILDAWAAAHIRVCTSFLDTLPQTGEDARTARYVARTTREAWETLPDRGASFVSIATVWLEGYRERLEPELAGP